MADDALKHDQMKAIRDELISNRDLPLYAYRVSNNFFPVVGEGSHDAKIMFVGEAPGLNEAKTGRPFCGRSGIFLEEMLASIGLKRPDVYITNVVKDRPPENRDPEVSEIEAYGPYLERQIAIIKPKVIVTLGRFSMAYLFDKLGLASKLLPISQIHGQEFEVAAPQGTIRVVPLYHPAVALYNGSNRATLLEDFKVLKKFI